MKKLYIIKIGGNIIDSENELNNFLDSFASVEGLKILVHGGGKLATELSGKLGIETKMVSGRRITNAETLKITAMVYAGWINKSIIAKLQSKNCNALGLSGADGKCIIAEKRQVKDINYGFAGDILPNGIDTAFIQNVLEFGVTPVFSPITANVNGQLLNTNADTIASALAGALSELYSVHLVYCFQKAGVLSDKHDENSVIEKIDSLNFGELKSQGVIADGMIPKLDNAFKAKDEGVSSVIIGHAKNLTKIIKKEKNAGTLIEN
ncbi:MAG: acetylglutamate kinase [Bacteroidia bacterium]